MKTTTFGGISNCIYCCSSKSTCRQLGIDGWPVLVITMSFTCPNNLVCGMYIICHSASAHIYQGIHGIPYHSMDHIQLTPYMSRPYNFYQLLAGGKYHRKLWIPAKKVSNLSSSPSLIAKHDFPSVVSVHRSSIRTSALLSRSFSVVLRLCLYKLQICYFFLQYDRIQFFIVYLWKRCEFHLLPSCEDCWD